LYDFLFLPDKIFQPSLTTRNMYIHIQHGMF